MRPLVMTTRAGFDAETRAGIEARGCEAVSAPVFTIRHFRPVLPPSAQAILVTSSNALPALQPWETRLLAVGDATAARARAAGFTDVGSASGDAEALAALAARVLSPEAGPLLLASGAGQGHALASNLRARGFRVVRRVCYAAKPVRRFPYAGVDALKSGRLRAVLFLSAETAEVFVRLLPPEMNDALATVSALAIGKTTADALEPLPWLRICRARTPTLDDVLALI